MGGYKAPGLDGLQAMCFQSWWHLVGEDPVNLVHGIFRNPNSM